MMAGLDTDGILLYEAHQFMGNALGVSEVRDNKFGHAYQCHNGLSEVLRYRLFKVKDNRRIILCAKPLTNGIEDHFALRRKAAEK